MTTTSTTNGSPQRVIAIGDIHGCLPAFDRLLAMVEPTAADRIITLGDYVDRGPDSAGVLDRLLELHAADNLVALRGNHDQMMLEARGHYPTYERWLSYGGRATLHCYAERGYNGTLDDIPERHWQFLENICVDWFETDSHFFVHANVYPDLPLHEQPRYMLLWERFFQPSPHFSGKVMVCGHTAQKTGVPLNIGHAICIDTWVYGWGWLTAFDVKSGKIWQSNQRGETRTAHIDDYAVS